MRVYFVRHGQSVGNADDAGNPLKWDDSDTLTQTGQEQARKLGKRLQNKGITKIIHSPLKRAVETTEGINETLRLPTEEHPDLYEVVAPSDFYEVPLSERLQHSPHIWMSQHNDDPDYILEDGESFNHALGRVKRVQEFLLGAIVGDVVLVVTHGDWLRFFLGHAIFEDEFQPKHFDMLWSAQTANTGISIFEYSDHPTPMGRDPRYWQLVTWMDRAHL